MKKKLVFIGGAVVQLSLVGLIAGTAMAGKPGSTTGGKPGKATTYKVIAYNDLGMHCACPTSSSFLLLPPFNTIRAQVLQIGANDPVLPTTGITVSYQMVENTDASLINDAYFSTWIAYAPKIFPGYQPLVNGKVVGLTGNGLSGTMTYDATSKSWIATGIPAFPALTGTSTDVMTDPLGGPNRTPYLTANVTVKNTAGATLATTATTVPVAFGGCCSCHLDVGVANGFPRTPEGSFQAMGKLHGQNSSKINIAQLDPDGDGVGGPVRCSECHLDPAMGETVAPGFANVHPNFKILAGATFTKADVKVSTMTFSEVLHNFHSGNDKVLAMDPNIDTNCYACHPGNGIECYRGSMKTDGFNCVSCHGTLSVRASSGQTAQPWNAATLPSCNKPAMGVAGSCHSSTSYPDGGGWASSFAGKYINNRGHKGSILCTTCHGSPHADAPATTAKDNAQNLALQGSARALGKCSVCHPTKSTSWGVPNHTAGNSVLP